MDNNLNEIKDALNNNQGVLTLSLFICTILFAWMSGFLKWIKNEVSKGKSASKVICAWDLLSSNEDPDFFEYKFGPRFQNKTDVIIKDFWINFATSGFELSVNESAQTILFDGWNVRNEALHLTTKDSYKFAPQNFVVPFIITLKLRKNLPNHGAWFYVSYGIPNSKKVELDYKFTFNELKKFINKSNHSGEDFLKYMGVTTKSYWKVRVIRLFWK